MNYSIKKPTKQHMNMYLLTSPTYVLRRLKKNLLK